MTTTPIKQRIAALTISLAAAAALGTAVGVATTAVAPQPAHAYNPGGKLTVKTVMARANWWMNTYNVVYSQEQNQAKSDGTGEAYRPDCSGFVSMAWHLLKKNDGWDLNTDNFWNRSGTFSNGVAVSSLISHVAVADLRQGDGIVGSGHIRLFDRWGDSSKSTMWVYEEYKTGLPGRYELHPTPWSWRGVRYSKIVSETALSITQFCEYSVTSGTIRRRSGPGYDYTGEGTYGTGAKFMASTQTYSSWRKTTLPLWVLSGDGGTILRSAGGCISA